MARIRDYDGNRHQVEATAATKRKVKTRLRENPRAQEDKFRAMVAADQL